MLWWIILTAFGKWNWTKTVGLNSCFIVWSEKCKFDQKAKTETLLLLFFNTVHFSPQLYFSVNAASYWSFSCALQTYLKEIMREIGVCNRKGAHKSTWELKPEYRHYRPSEEEEQKSPWLHLRHLTSQKMLYGCEIVFICLQSVEKHV